MPISRAAPKVESRAISAKDKEATVVPVLRKAYSDARLYGQRKKKADAEAAAEANK